MKLTVVLLTRNHAASLERALKSVAPVADELLVADTGSTDQTIAIAQQNGAKVVTIPFADDFGTACNAALAEAAGDWILQLNPDEEVTDFSRHYLKSAIAVPTAFAYVVQVRQEFRPTPPGLGNIVPELRLFRRDPAVHYQGRLHPRFVPPLEKVAADYGRAVQPASILILRHAYLSKPTPDKLRFTLRLLEAELRDRPGQLNYLIEYGRHLLWLGDPRGHEVLADVVATIRPRLYDKTPPNPEVGQLIEYLLTVSPEQSKTDVSREDARELALRWFPQTPPVLWTAANERFTAGDYRTAADLLARLVHLGNTGVFDAAGGFDISIVTTAARMNLGICHIHLRNWTYARDALVPLLRDPELGQRAARLYAEVERNMQP